MHGFQVVDFKSLFYYCDFLEVYFECKKQTRVE